jgi:predicted dehydrogenase
MPVESPVRVAIVGVGHAGQAHRSFCMTRDDLRLVALVDSGHRPDQPPPLFTSLPAMWAMGLDVDLVVVCTPPGARRAVVEAALQRGVSCICEKPLAPSSELAVDFVDAARGPTVLLPVRNYLYAPWWQDLRARAELTGPPRSLEVDIMRPHAARGVNTYRPGWRTVPEIAGGGVLWDIGVHALYLAQALFDSSPVAASAPVWREENGCEIECKVRFDFPGDRHLTFHGCWDSPLRQSRWRISTAAGAASTVEAHSPTGTGRWLDGVYEEFLTLRRQRRTARGTVEAAVQTIAALEAARRSGRQAGRRQPVRVDRR